MEILDTPEAAKFMKLSPRTLEKWRITGQGPPFKRLGRKRVVYMLDDLIVWINGN